MFKLTKSLNTIKSVLRFSTKEKAPSKAKTIDKSDPFVPYKELTPEIKEKRLYEHKREMDYYFGSPKHFEGTHRTNNTEFFAKAMRHRYLLAGAFSKEKHIIRVKRLRQPKDTIESLKKNKEIACCIKGREEIPDFDFVVDRNFVNRLDKLPNWQTRPIYIEHNNELIRTTVQEFLRHIPEYWVHKVNFQRFIPGRPNLIRFPLEIVGKQLNPYIFLTDVENIQYFKEVDLWVFNEDYPPRIEIDARLFSPTQTFKFRDLKYMLPDGMYLHKSYDNKMNQAIFSMAENYNVFLAATKYTADIEEKIDASAQDKEVHQAAQDLIKEVTEGRKVRTAVHHPLGVASAKRIIQVKGEGGDNKAFKTVLSKTKGKKDKKK